LKLGLTSVPEYVNVVLIFILVMMVRVWFRRLQRQRGRRGAGGEGM